MSMFIFCRNIELSIFFYILGVLLTTKIKRNHFYGLSISVKYASLAHAKSERNKTKIFSFLISGCFETGNDIRYSFIL